MRFLSFIFGLISLGVVVGGVGIGYVVWHFGKDLPDYEQLAQYEPPVMTRVQSADGELIAEFARERRIFAPISSMPKTLIGAFLSAEDKNFYTHPGVDALGVLRAVVSNVRNAATGGGRRPEGASTITQQLMKNFLLTSERSYERKVKEALLAFRFEQAFTKDQILELYLNEIYLGAGAYGVTSAALTYFDRHVTDLSVAQMAYLAALPKAPNNYHPVRRKQSAMERRNWVIDRMVENGYITAADATAARAEDLSTVLGVESARPGGGYFVEEVRRQLLDMYGEAALYGGGLSVRSTLDPVMQRHAEKALRSALVEYDRARGWRGAAATFDTTGGWQKGLSGATVPRQVADWRLAAVVSVDAGSAEVGADGQDEPGTVAFETMGWARDFQSGRKPRRASDVVQPGDLIYVSAVDGAANTWALQQPPEVQGGLVAMEVATGRVLAMQGGFSYDISEFNRATQARRQPGSSFKPFVYAAALEDGFTPSSIIVDAPIVIDQGPGLGLWKPTNYSSQFYGPSTLRLGIEKSRNLMTVRLAQDLGMPVVQEIAARFGIDDKMPPVLSMSLGAGETTVMRMTAAYAMLGNGGKRLQPTLIDRVQDRRGATIFRADQRMCVGCGAGQNVAGQPPLIQDQRPAVIDAATAYQMVSIMEGVVQRGTATSLKKLKRPLAGKTGTTNDAKDAWFMAMTPDLAVGVYIGFDNPRTLGRGATGGGLAAPVVNAFLAAALEGVPAREFPVPEGIEFIPVDLKSGRRVSPGTGGAILEAFKDGTGPEDGPAAIMTGYQYESVGETKVLLTTGSGGLY